MKKKRLKIYLKFGILLFGVSFLVINCQTDEPLTFDDNPKNVKTVTFEQAKAFFEEKQTNEIYLHRASGNPIELNPNWNSLEQQEIAYTDALLTKADTEVNRDGNFISRLVFLNIDNEIKSVVLTTWNTYADANNNLIDGFLFLNEYDGTFIDAYKIENGLFTHKLIPNNNQVSQAGFFSILMLFQSNGELTADDCWNTDNLPEDGQLGTVDLGTIKNVGGNNVGGGGYTGGNINGPSGPGNSYGGYINGAVWGISGGGGSGNGISANGINKAAAAVLTATDDYVPIINPCQSLSKLTQTDSLSANIRPIVDSLRGKMNSNKEWYTNFKQSEDSDYDGNTTTYTYQEQGIAASTSINSAPVSIGPSFIGQIHTHPNSRVNMFSWYDLRALKQVYEGTYTAYRNDVFIMMVGSNDEIYTIKVDDINTLINALNADLANAKGNDNEKKEGNIIKFLKEKYGKSNNLEQTFLELYGNHGISLFKATDTNLSNWKQLELEPTDDEIVKETPCN